MAFPALIIMVPGIPIVWLLSKLGVISDNTDRDPDGIAFGLLSAFFGLLVWSCTLYLYFGVFNDPWSINPPV